MLHVTTVSELKFWVLPKKRVRPRSVREKFRVIHFAFRVNREAFRGSCLAFRAKRAAFRTKLVSFKCILLIENFYNVSHTTNINMFYTVNNR